MRRHFLSKCSCQYAVRWHGLFNWMIRIFLDCLQRDRTWYWNNNVCNKDPLLKISKERESNPRNKTEKLSFKFRQGFIISRVTLNALQYTGIVVLIKTSYMTSLIIKERVTSYFPYIWVQIESIATLLYNLDKKGPLLKISMSSDRKVFIYIVLTLCSLKYRPQALQTGSPFWFLLQRVVAVVLQFAQLVPSRREEDWTKKTYLKGLYV